MKQHPDVKWVPCSQGGLWQCVECEASYCSPPWTKEKVLAEQCYDANPICGDEVCGGEFVCTLPKGHPGEHYGARVETASTVKALAQQYIGRADDCGRLARIVLAQLAVRTPTVLGMDLASGKDYAVCTCTCGKSNINGPIECARTLCPLGKGG